MKRTKTLLAIAILFVMASCGKKVDVALNSTIVNFAAEGESVEVVLTSNGDWTVDAYPEWLSVNPTSGNGNATLTLVAPQNDGDDTRSGEVRVSTKDNSAMLTVSQEAVEKDFIIVSPESIECESEGGVFTLTVTSNCDWALNTSMDWLSCEPTSGSGDGTVTVSITPIEGDIQIRETDIIFSGVGNELRPIHVVQHAAVHFPIYVEPDNVMLEYEATELTVLVSCEGGWTVSSDADWVTLGATSGNGNTSLTLMVAENEDMEARAANVTFLSETEDHASLVIKQEGAPDPHYLVVTPQIISFDKDGGTADININCDMYWTIALQSTWLSLSDESGTGDATITLTADANPISEPRNNYFDVISNGLSQRIIVVQEAGDAPVSVIVSPDTLYAAYLGGFRHFSIISNANWTLVSPDSWIILQTTSGTGNGEIDIIVDSNNTIEERVGVVNIIHNLTVVASVVVVQEGRPSILETDITEINVDRDGGTFTIHITANQAWNTETSVDWLTCIPSSGNGDGKFLVKITPLTMNQPRSTELRINGSFGSYIVIPVTQSN